MAETRREIVSRRLRTIPLLLLAFAALTVTLPVLVVVGLLVDVVRWIRSRVPFMSVRIILFAWVFVAAGVFGVVALFASWVVSGFGRNDGRMIRQAYAVQGAWVVLVLGSAKALFRLTFDAENVEVATPGPLLVFARHASIVDNLLPAWFIVRQHGIKLRYVLKRELLADPVLDVGGLRLINHFIDRDAANPRAELEGIAELAKNLPDDEGVLIFPEGTRFTEERRAKALSRIGDAAARARAEQLTHVLPPRPGGAATLLKAAPEVDVIIFAHRGLEGLAKVKDVWNGGMVRRTVKIKMWRVPASQLPQDRKSRSDWLFDEWVAINRWIVEQTG